MDIIVICLGLCSVAGLTILLVIKAISKYSELSTTIDYLPKGKIYEGHKPSRVIDIRGWPMGDLQKDYDTVQRCIDKLDKPYERYVYGGPMGGLHLTKRKATPSVAVERSEKGETMTTRLPKVGEVWTADNSSVKVMLVDNENIYYEYCYGGGQTKLATGCRLKTFLVAYNPPKEPKKVFWVNEYTEQVKLPSGHCSFDTHGIQIGCLFETEGDANFAGKKFKDKFIRSVKLVEVDDEDDD